ncbi:MAG: ATP-binding cassette domain-containing protein [Candidatus Lokiarchaeota archaeon]
MSDVLDLTVTKALELFKSNNSIANVLQILKNIGMGYITLGQPATTLSGGEAQRIKLAKELGSAKKSNTLYILDEPTVGLSFFDTIQLMRVLDRLVDQGNSVIIIEHDPEILSFVDYLIELGPGGGPEGGNIINQGSPKNIKKSKTSIIGPYLTIK